jgi:hypothetical protein
MRVIDGRHRLLAAARRGDTHIAVRYFDGTERDAFVLAVEQNKAHGLPLTAADRKRAAERIIASHQEWSDRAIAAVTGLADKTVAAIRRRHIMTEEGSRPLNRVGRDGRVRPVSTAEGRRIASKLIASQPDASLRTIAKTAGISPSTARDVRDRLRRGDDPIPSRQRRPQEPAGCSGSAARTIGTRELGTPWMEKEKSRSRAWSLRRDPAFRFNETGRMLLRMLEIQLVTAEQREQLLEAVPAHQMDTVAMAARECAIVWQEFAEQLTSLSRSQHSCREAHSLRELPSALRPGDGSASRKSGSSAGAT